MGNEASLPGVFPGIDHHQVYPKPESTNITKQLIVSQSKVWLPEQFIQEKRVNGLTNSSNNCYIIALFRLFSSTYFKALFSDTDHFSEEKLGLQFGSRTQLLYILYSDWIIDNKPRDKALKLSNFIPYVQTKLHFGTAQQDISELFNLLIENINEELNFVCHDDIMTIECVYLSNLNLTLIWY